MTRYFFHFASEDEFIPDYDGAVLGGLKAAHAMRSASSVNAPGDRPGERARSRNKMTDAILRAAQMAGSGRINGVPSQNRWGTHPNRDRLSWPFTR